MTVLGLFGGASLNSLELSLVQTDGIDVHKVIKTAVVPYPEPLVMDIRSVIGVADLCRRFELFADGCDFYGCGHSGLYMG